MRSSTDDFDVTNSVAIDVLARLTPMHRLVLVLHYVDDLSVADVALAIGRSVRACESLLVRARRALDENLTEDRDV